MGDVSKTERIKLPGTTASAKDAENIFKEIEKKTGTFIQFESGHFTNTYRGDPIIKVCGEPAAVQIAKDMVLENLELHSNRIIMKIDITHEEHKSLIGKKGHLIQKVMECTDCQVHFPDTNKIETNIKSNLVSISGEPLNVEKARIMVRALLPFQVTFDVDTSSGQVMNTTLPIWKQIHEELGLEIKFTKNKYSLTVAIRCCQGLFSTLRTQILSVIELLSGKGGSNLPQVAVIMDIMPQHHDFVKGPKGSYSYVHAISKYTGAKIVFPNLNSVASEARTVTISGNLDCVYMAWQEVMNVLPVSVSFDVSETRETNNDFLAFLTDCNVFIYHKPKPKYKIQSVTVKAPEKFSKQLIQYRQRILNLPPIKFESDMDIINNALFLQEKYAMDQQNSNKIPFNSPLHDSTRISNLNNYFQKSENSVQGFISHDATFFPCFPYADQNKISVDGNNWTDFKPTKYVAPGFTTSPPDLKSSVYYPDEFNYCTAFPDNNNEVDTRIHELKPTDVVADTLRNSDSFMAQNLPLKNQGVNEYEVFEKRLSAHQAIHRNIESTQVPSNLWSGYGFSQSMPASCINKSPETTSPCSCRSLESNSSSSDDSLDINFPDFIDDKIWFDHGENFLSKSNVFDFKINSSKGMEFYSEDILPRLLYQEGLYNYIDTFLREEIDYETFLLLNEYDLIQLGINYQARMKITCLIRKELQGKDMKKSFDAAPGAERKQNYK